ncbi:protein takeout-like [Haematobia irritans]|uniref:protein takeout-like n=1 Tax=Haematobia irritans TaxID=7368 RepID=UPI003F5062E2
MLNSSRILILFVMYIMVQAEIPTDFPRCKNADESCLVKASNEVIANYYTGLPSIALKSFDPLHIEKLVLKRNPKSPVNIEVQLSNLEVEGFKTLKVSKFQGLRKDLSGRSIFVGTIDNLEFKGHYIIDGKVLILPITGEGNCHFTCKNINFTYSFDLTSIEKKGKLYGNLEHVLGQVPSLKDNIQ